MSNALGAAIGREVLPQNEHRHTVLNEPFPETKELPFYHLLPTDHVELLKFRIYARNRAVHDLGFRRDLLDMARQDIGFFCAVFVCIFEPRPPVGPTMIPMKPWLDQLDALVLMHKWFGKRDMAVPKTRGIGMSWTASILFSHALLFMPGADLGMVSKDEAGADSQDEQSLMGKVVYITEHLPAWMRIDKTGASKLKRNLTHHTLTNLENGASIQAFPATDQKARGMRFTAYLADEAAFYPRDAQAALNTNQHTTPCRIFVSTYNGSNNPFYEMVYNEPQSTTLRIHLFWWANPARWAGAYTTEQGRVKILDESYDYPPDYPFILDGLRRSPWVDYEMRRAGSSTQSLKEEFYGIQVDEGRKLFRQDTLSIIETTLRPPQREGHVTKRPDGKYVWQEERGGPIKIWGTNVTESGGGPYSAACDLAYGRRSAYSTLEVLDLVTGEQVLEYADNAIDIVSFAQKVYGVLSWLCGKEGQGHCYLTFENNGDIGLSFCTEILRLGWSNVMKRPYRHKKPEGESSYYGVRNRDGGMQAFLEMERAARDAEVIVRSQKVHEEMGLFDRDEEKSKVKPAFPYRADGHGDRTQALALAWWQARQRQVESPTEKIQPKVEGQVGWELFEEELNAATKSDGRWSSAWRMN